MTIFALNNTGGSIMTPVCCAFSRNICWKSNNYLANLIEIVLLLKLKFREIINS